MGGLIISFPHTQTNTHADTDRLCGLDGHKAVVPLLPADIAKGSVVRDVLGDVGDLVNCVVVLEDLKGNRDGECLIIHTNKELHRTLPSKDFCRVKFPKLINLFPMKYLFVKFMRHNSQMPAP